MKTRSIEKAVVPLPGVEGRLGDPAATGGWAFGLVERAKALICLCRDGRIVYINRTGVRLLGLRHADEVLGRRFDTLVHPDFIGIYGEVLADGAGATDAPPIKLIGPGGVEADVELTAVPVVEPGAAVSVPPSVVIQGRDISERLRSADAVRRSETRYRHLVENAQDLICVCRDGVVCYINPAGAEALGADDPAALSGRRLADLVHPDYRGVIEDGLGALVEEGMTIPLKFVRLDGITLDMAVGVIPYVVEGDGDAYMIEAHDITEQVRSAQSLREREARLRGIVDTVADAIVTIDERGMIQSFNPAATIIFGYEASEAIGENVTVLMPVEAAADHDGYLRRYLQTGKAHVVGVSGREVTGRRRDGTEFPLEIAVTELRHGRQRLFTGILRDITERKRAEEALRRANDELELRVEERTRELTQEITDRRRAEEQLRLAAKVIENTSEGVIITDAVFRVTSVNPAFSEITGYRAEDVIGRPPPFYDILAADVTLFERMQRNVSERGRWEGEIWNRRKSGTPYAERLSVSAITDASDCVQQYAVMISDVTKRKKDEERIRYQANYDALTGLPNRVLFMDRLSQALANASRSGRKLGLMFIDLDGFKLINDTLGHDIGDLLLKEASRRLGHSVRTGDTVARLGGDEFTVIMPNLIEPQHAPIVAQRILDALVKPFHLAGHEAFVSGSIGITIFPDDATEATGLLKNADGAMYRAKEQGKANYQFFTTDLNQQVEERLRIKNGLSKAMERQELSLSYQPKLDLKSGRVFGVEALMRWTNADLGVVSPGRFIPVLEETGLVVEVGEWALRVACLQHRAWKEDGLPLRVAVNLSARQLKEPGFVDIVVKVLEETGIGPEGLEIEITESMLMSDADRTVVALRTLHDMGIHVAMDDFGTGYSSLSYLRRFPIDTIKIDRSFVADIATNPDDAEIIRTIITMGQTLNRKVVAEGVETEEQLSILRDYQCDEIQGYLYSPPLPGERLTRFLKERDGAPT